ncbi:glutathione S-transferase family protein [Solimonas soli]|uniref:glutathione S-transferase family protein n=1 Tax=Solimonas soli TaxID=413479 RepID=UPI0004842EA4|nr:glutathione S-transferase family protein [Solimonas soli]
MITLYHSPDARSFRCLWALEEARVAYDLKVMAFPPRAHAPDYLALNPCGTVPLLVDGDSTLFESAAILEWLSVRYAPTTLGVGSEDKAYGSWLSWLHFGEASLTTLLSTMLRYAVFLPEAQRQPAVVADFRGLFLERLQLVERALADHEYLAADRFTAADISVGYALMLARMLDLHRVLPPALLAYWARLQERPAFRAARAAQKAAAPAAA